MAAKFHCPVHGLTFNNAQGYAAHMRSRAHTGPEAVHAANVAKLAVAPPDAVAILAELETRERLLADQLEAVRSGIAAIREAIERLSTR